MISVSCARLQRRLRKNLPGQPPSGETVPSRASPRKYMPQAGASGAASIQRPAMPVGTDCAAEVEPPNDNPPPAQPASIRAMRMPPATGSLAIRTAVPLWLELEFDLKLFLSMLCRKSRFPPPDQVRGQAFSETCAMGVLTSWSE